MRRIVTGHDSSGASVIVSDTDVETVNFKNASNASFHRIYGIDQSLSLPNNGIAPKYTQFFPPIGGIRFLAYTILPGDAINKLSISDRETLFQEYEEKLPGLGSHMEIKNAGMHTSDTIDFIYIAEGTVSLELDGGAIVDLAKGDTIVQNGTRHAWRNRGTVPCQLIITIIGVERNPSGLEMANRANIKK